MEDYNTLLNCIQLICVVGLSVLTIGLIIANEETQKLLGNR